MRQLLIGLSLALCLGPLAAGSSAQSTFREEGLHSARPGLYAIRGATIHVSGAEQIEGGTVVLLHDKILAVGKELDVPAGAIVIDGTGKHLYPGLIDSYVGYTAELPPVGEATANANSRITPQLQLSEVFKLDQLNAAERRAAGFTNALVAPTAGIIRGTSFLTHLPKTQSNRTVLSPVVAMQARLTLDRAFGGGPGGGYPSSPMGAYALARQTLLDAKWYRDAWQVARIKPEVPRPEVNASLEALQPVLTGALPLMVETTNELFVLRARRFADEFGLRLVVVGNGNEYRRLDDVVATRAPLVLPLDFPKAPKVGSPADVLDVALETLMHWDHAPGNPAALVKAGATIAFSTQGLEKPGDWRSQIRRAIERGLDPGVALDAWTRVPAKLYGVEDQLGTVAGGKLANLVITNGPLFEEKTKILETWVLGERFEHQPAPLRQFAGIWHLKSDADPLMSLYLVVRDEGKVTSAIRKSAEPNPEDPDLELKGVEAGGVRLSGTLEAAKLGGTGTALLELIVDRPGEGLGTLAFADGRSLKFQSTRVGDAEKAAPRGGRGRGQKEGGGESIAGSDAAPATEAKKPDGAPEGTAVAETSQEAQTKPPADQGAEAGKSAEQVADQSKSSPADTAPLYGVNYPLGDFGREQPPAAPGRVLFVNATVWTCGPEGKLEGAAVLVEGGLITRIVKSGEALPAADLTIDALGRHLTPGIIDCHSHMATDSGVNEGSQAITAEVRIGDFVDCDDLNIIRQLAGGVTCVNVLHGSANPIGGQNQVIKLRWGRNDEQLKFVEAPPGIKFALGENVKRSSSPQPSTRYPRSRMGVEQLMQDSFRAAKEYEARKAEYQRTRSGLPPRIDLELETLAEIVRGERWIHCHSYRQDEILALLRVLEEHHITIGSLQHILEGYKVAEAMAKHGAMASAFSDWWAYKVEVYDAIPQAGALMHQQGIVVSFNSDDAELARHLNHEAAKAVRYGNVPEDEALKFVTLNPAKQLRIDRYVGSIEVGKQADLALWSGHPLDTLSRCEQTWVDGIKYFDREEQAALSKQQAEMKLQLVQKALGAKQTAGGVESKVDPASLWLRHDEYCHGHAHDEASGDQADAEFLDLLLYHGNHAGHNHGDGIQRKPR